MRTTLYRRQDLARENHSNGLDKSTTFISVLLPDILQIFFLSAINAYALILVRYPYGHGPSRQWGLGQGVVQGVVQGALLQETEVLRTSKLGKILIGQLCVLGQL